MLSIHSNPVKEDTKWSDDDDDDDEDKDEDNAYAEVDAIAKNDDRSARFTSTEDEEKEEAEAAQMAKSSRKVGRIHHVNPDGTGSVGESAQSLVLIFYTHARGSNDFAAPDRECVVNVDLSGRTPLILV